MIDKGLVSGSTTMLILSLLSERDMYGYEMIELLSQRSQNVFELKTGTLYPLLHQLVKTNYLNCYENEVNGKKRKYYQLTNLFKSQNQRVGDLFCDCFRYFRWCGIWTLKSI